MTDERMAARLVFPGFKCGVDDPSEAVALAELGVGGFCLYGGRPAEVAELTALLSSRAKAPLLFCADYEDGVATQCPGATPLPANMGLGAANSETLAYEKGVLTGCEARALGVRWVLAPVCDLATNADNPIVNVRAFSEDPVTVTRLARAFLQGLRSEGTMGCLKHFPGHGETSLDSHIELPKVGTPKAVINQRELAPFRSLAADAESVMTGHLAVPALEKESGLPYSLSSDVAKTLRKGLGFAGLVSTDALNMRSVAGRFEPLDSARRALLGGSDVLLVPEDPRGLLRLLEEALPEEPRLAAAASAALARLDKAIAGLKSLPAPALETVGSPEHMAAAEAMAEHCLAWVGPETRLAPGTAVEYWEPEAEPGDWLGEDLVAALRAGGVAVRPYEGRAEGRLVITGLFLGPRAYTGRISLGDDAAEVRAKLAQAGRSLAVSFGSPFVFAELNASGLCAFSRSGPAQKAAAGALLGRVSVKGRLPVTLKGKA